MDLKKTLFIVPNLLTAASLLCGVWAVMRCVGPEATSEDVYQSALLLFYAFIFDLFDGRVARMTRTQSSFGVEFDSLADLISFGVAPAVITYRWALSEIGIAGIMICFVYVLGGAIRLARFNVMAQDGQDKKSTPGKYMLGLPIPMAAAFIVALAVAARAMGGWPWLTSHGITVKGITYPMMAVVMLVLAFLMVSAVKFRSFKDLKLNLFSVSLLGITIISSLVLWLKSKPAYILIWLLCIYVALGFGEAILFWPSRRRERLAAEDRKSLH
ncbi:MAG: CDP-diacylglycerol--serine O-phosphatidyltransferase [Proteobacteria bacterium]|nr:CDP-diacylglycerol--serine O-phosphatidyltransferase [Pseudomonadota bacterium]